jgi:hypothetical protein
MYLQNRMFHVSQQCLVDLFKKLSGLDINRIKNIEVVFPNKFRVFFLNESRLDKHIPLPIARLL